MKKFALSLVIVLASTTLAFAAAQTDDHSVDRKVSSVPKVASGQNVTAKTGSKPNAKPNAKADAKADAKAGDITIKGKAGNVTNVGYGQNAKTETNVGSVKGGGQ
ncbi:MAG: hypothetical protein Q8S17_01715 [Humidesulfovibrio sp.]|nr:hypothetical protein [Humidesulfovibrio sp.]